MIGSQRSGIPHTQTIQADGDGVCVRLPAWSVSIQVSAKSPVRLYWTQQDFDDDRNGIDLSGEENDADYAANASVGNLWLRGAGGQAEVTITSLGIG